MVKEFYKNFKVRDYMENEGKVESVLDCSLGTNPFIEEKDIKKYISKATCIINEYPVNRYNELKDVIVDIWNKNTDANINAKNISFGAGSMGILRNLSEFLIDSDTYILGCAPQFPRFISEVELKKGIYEYYSFNKELNYKFVVDEFLEMIDKKYSLIHIDNPNNPTGQIIDIKDIEKIVEKAKKYDITVLIDEAYGDYMEFKNSAITLVSKYDNLVVLRSASKYYGLPNHRVGYLVASEEFLKVYNMITIPFPFSDFSCNVFTMILKDYKKYEKIRQQVIDANKEIYNAISKENFLYTSIETPIFTIKSDKYDNLTEKIMKHGIVTESCNNFFELDEHYSRIRIPKENDYLIKVLTKIL